MSDPLKCVFLPRSFHVSDITALVYFCETEPNPLPSVKLSAASINLEFHRSPAFADGRVTWPLSLPPDHPAVSATVVLVTPDGSPPIEFDLTALVFLCPGKDSGPPGVFLLEFTSGIYGPSSESGNEYVQFTVDSMLALRYDHVLMLRQQLEELSRARSAFEDRKRAMEQDGIDFSRFAAQKAEYEELTRRKRRAQHEFLRQNQQMQAATIHSQAEYDFGTAVENLRKHTEANEQLRLGSGRRRPEVLIRFRSKALAELQQIFPLEFGEQRFCHVAYVHAPTTQPLWNDMRAFLGFATHYVKEVSRAVGIPLPYLLVPQGGVSRATSRLTDEKHQLTPEFTQQAVKAGAAFEAALVMCAKHMLDTLHIPVDFPPGGGQILVAMKMLSIITEENLRSLLPDSLAG
jgi:hypothetical protein